MDLAQLEMNHVHLCVSFDCVLIACIGFLSGLHKDSVLGVCVSLFLRLNLCSLGVSVSNSSMTMMMTYTIMYNQNFNLTLKNIK